MSASHAYTAGSWPAQGDRILQSREARVIALACFAVYLVIVGAAVWLLPFPNNFDELAHLSYATAIARHGLTGLNLFALRLLSPTLAPGFTTAPNYLNHPPAYYLLLSQFLPADSWPTLGTVRVLRLLNAGLSAASVGCALAVGVLRRYQPRLLLLYALIVVLTPMLWCVGGAINNDNMAYLGGSICVLGTQLMETHDGSRTGATLLTVGAATATLAKLTAGLMTVGFATVFLVLRWQATGQRPSARLLLSLSIMLALACIPYLWFVSAYGSPAPVTPAFRDTYREIAVLFQTQHLDLHGWQTGRQMGLLGYSAQFASWLLADWNPVTDMTGWRGTAVLLPPAALLALASFAWLANGRPSPNHDRMILAGGIALAMVVPLHLGFSYAMDRAVGSPPFDAMPRYYLPLALSVVPLSACWSVQRICGRGAAALCWTLMAGLSLAALTILASHAALFFG